MQLQTQFGHGMMSQLIGHLQEQTDHLAHIPRLPPDAQLLQKRLVAGLNEELKDLVSVRKRIQVFVPFANQTIQRMQAEVDSGKTNLLSSPLLTQLNTKAKALSTQIHAADARLTDRRAMILDLENQVQRVKANYDHRTRKLKAQSSVMRQRIRDKQAEADRLKWLAFIPVAGLIIVLTALRDLQHDLNQMMAEEAKQRHMAAQLEGVAQFIGTLNKDIEQIVSTWGSIKNGVEFLENELTQVVAHANDTGPILKVYLMEALSRLQTLATDAS